MSWWFTFTDYNLSWFIGFHQRCHNPPIPASALELDSPWNCFYCQKGTKCPFLTESLDVLQNLLSDDEQSKDADNESVATTESDQFDEGSEDYPARPTALKKRKFKVCIFKHFYCMKSVLAIVSNACVYRIGKEDIWIKAEESSQSLILFA